MISFGCALKHRNSFPSDGKVFKSGISSIDDERYQTAACLWRTFKGPFCKYIYIYERFPLRSDFFLELYHLVPVPKKGSFDMFLQFWCIFCLLLNSSSRGISSVWSVLCVSLNALPLVEHGYGIELREWSGNGCSCVSRDGNSFFFCGNVLKMVCHYFYL